MNPDRARVYGAVTLGGLLFVAALYGTVPASSEAQVRDVVGLRLLANTTDGRQALVSSVWWAPLPTLLRLPAAFLSQGEHLPTASLLVSTAFGAAALALLDAMLRAWGVGRYRLLVAAALALNPVFLRECLNGSSTTLVVFLMLAVVEGLVLWVGQRKLRGLTVLAISAALLLLSSAEIAPWVVAVLALVAAGELTRRPLRRERGAVLILLLFPAVYALGLWVLANWLIMGDPLYFVRSLFAHPPEEGVLPWRDLWGGGLAPLSLAAAILLLANSAGVGSRAGATLGVAALAPVGVAALLRWRGWLWEPAPVLFSLMPLGMLAFGLLLHQLRHLTIGLRLLACAAPLAVSLALWSGGQAFAWRFAAPGGPSPSVVEARVWLPNLEREVLKRSRYVKVFVCGYESFPLLGARSGRIFEHALDFNFYKAAQDYRGHALFLLVQRPVGRSAMDSIHWKYGDFFVRGASSTLYYGDWGAWRLFEIVQAPRERSRGEE